MATEAMTSAPAFFGRLFWMIVGPCALAICTISIIDRADGWLGPVNLIYFFVLGAMIAGRWTEFRCSRPLTATGEPATVEHLSRYTLWLSVLGVGIWFAANMVGSHAIRLLG